MKIIFSKDDLIIEAKKIKNSDEFNQFIEHYANYLEEIMQRDIPDIDINLRKKLKKEIIDFINQAIRKGYINENNQSKCLERLIKSTQKIENMTDPFTYGICYGSHSRFNFNNLEFQRFMKHYVFHELTHSITDIDNFTRNSEKNNLGEYKYHEAQKIGIGVIPAGIETIIDERFMQFLNEIMAESTACDLANSYLPQKEIATRVPTYLKSDWHTPNNRAYQQLGYEFLQIFLFPNNNLPERQLFKNLTLQSINDVDIGNIILETAKKINPNSYKEDLHEISIMLGKICFDTRLSLSENDVQKIRNIMKKYQNLINISHNPNYKSDGASRWTIPITSSHNEKNSSHKK